MLGSSRKVALSNKYHLSFGICFVSGNEEGGEVGESAARAQSPVTRLGVEPNQLSHFLYNRFLHSRCTTVRKPRATRRDKTHNENNGAAL